MRKLLIFLYALLVVVLPTWAASNENSTQGSQMEEFVQEVQANSTPSTSTASAEQQLQNFKSQLEKVKQKDLSLKERLAVKLIEAKLKKAEKKAAADIKQGKEAKSDVKGLLTTLGIIFIIVGAVLLLLSLFVWGFGYHSPSLLVLGLILVLVAKYAL